MELGKINIRQEADKRKMLITEWAKTGKLAGLKGRDLGNMAILFENQKRYLNENNTTADINVFDTIAIPLIRRQYRDMITPKLVAMHPLNYSSGLVFYKDYTISTTHKPFGKSHLANDLSGGQADDFAGNSFEDQSGFDRHYDNGGYDTSKGRVISRGWNSVTSNFDNTTIGGQNDTAIAASLSKAGVVLTDAAGAEQKAIFDFDLSATGLSLKDLAAFRIYDAAGVYKQNVHFIVKKTIQNFADDIMSTGRNADRETTSTAGRDGGPGDPNKILRLQIIPIVDLPASTTINLRLAIKEYLNLEINAAFSSELKIRVKKTQIDTQIWKLKASWTKELKEDMEAYYTMDVDAELIADMSQELAQQKDRYVITELVQGAGHIKKWNADFYNAVDPNPANTVFRGIESTYNQGLFLAINELSEAIRKSTMYAANWVLISAEGYAKMRNLDTFRVLDVNKDVLPGEVVQHAGGIERVGTLNETMKIYVDPQLPAQFALVGRLGNSPQDTGYIYAPYREFELGEMLEDPQDGNLSRMIRSRVGTKIVNNKFYGLLVLKGIGSYEVVQPGVTV